MRSGIPIDLLGRPCAGEFWTRQESCTLGAAIECVDVSCRRESRLTAECDCEVLHWHGFAIETSYRTYSRPGELHAVARRVR